MLEEDFCFRDVNMSIEIIIRDDPLPHGNELCYFSFIEPSDKVKRVQDAFKEYLAIKELTIYEPRFIYEGKYLREEETLAYYGIVNNSTYQLAKYNFVVVDWSEKMFSINVRNESNESISVTIDPWNTLQDLRAKIADHWDIPPDKQRLLYQDKEMTKEKRTLSYYKFHEDCTIDVKLIDTIPKRADLFRK